MKVGVFTQSTGFWAEDLKYNVSKLMCEYRFKAPKQADLGGIPKRQGDHMAHILFNVMLNGNITVTRFTNGESGTKEVVPNVPIRDLVEISALNEGVVTVMQADPTDPDDEDYIARFSIDLCNSGAIYSDMSSYLRVELSGFTATSYGGIATDPQFTIFSAGSFQKVNEHIKYNRISAQAGSPVEFGARGAYAIAVPYDTERLTLRSLLGMYQEITAPELELIANDINDYVLDFGGIQIAYFKWRMLPINTMESGTIQVVTDSAFYLLEDKNYEAQSPATPGQPAIAITQLAGSLGKVNPVTV
jgi:hypothetical protein